MFPVPWNKFLVDSFACKAPQTINVNNTIITWRITSHTIHHSQVEFCKNSVSDHFEYIELVVAYNKLLCCMCYYY